MPGYRPWTREAGKNMARKGRNCNDELMRYPGVAMCRPRTVSAVTSNKPATSDRRMQADVKQAARLGEAPTADATEVASEAANTGFVAIRMSLRVRAGFREKVWGGRRGARRRDSGSVQTWRRCARYRTAVPHTGGREHRARAGPMHFLLTEKRRRAIRQDYPD